MVLGFSQGKPNPNLNPSPNPIWGVIFLGGNYPDTVSNSFPVHIIGDIIFSSPFVELIYSVHSD